MNGKYNSRDVLIMAQERGMSVRVIADRIGISRSSVCRIINGGPSNDSTLALVAANAHKLFGGKKETFEESIIFRCLDHNAEAIGMILKTIQCQERRIRLIERQLMSNVVELKREAG